MLVPLRSILPAAAWKQHCWLSLPWGRVVSPYCIRCWLQFRTQKSSDSDASTTRGGLRRSDDSTCSRDSSMRSKLACSRGLSGSFVLGQKRDLNHSYCCVAAHLTSPCRARTARQTSAQQRLSCQLGARPRRLQKRPALAGFAQTQERTLRRVVRWVSVPCDDSGQDSALFVSELRWQWENQGICIRAS